MTGIFVPWNPDRPNGPGWVEDGSGCHIWVGCRTTGGYGRVSVNRKMRRVVRVRYEREIAAIPLGRELDHYLMPGRCCTACCNPAHVRPATHRENMLRGRSIVSQNAAKTHCPHGHVLAGDNLVARLFRSRGRRVCRICVRARSRTYTARRAAGVLSAKKAHHQQPTQR